MEIKGWNEFVKRVMWVIENSCHTNDASKNETESDLCFAVDQLAKENGMPEPEWDYDKLYEDSDGFAN